MKTWVYASLYWLTLFSCSHPCVQPDVTLSQEVKRWTTLYKQKKVFVFRNQLGQIDTVSVQYKTIDELCGGEECSGRCEVERAIFTSPISKAPVLTLEARDSDLVVANNTFDSTYLYLRFDTKRLITFSAPKNINLVVNESYPYKTKAEYVLIGFCPSTSSCTRFKFTSYTISRDNGLLDYTDQQGVRWQRVD